MSFAGNLNTVSLPDVFQLIFTSKMTGGLKITKNKEEKMIYFKNGMLIFATSNDSQDLFGNILVKKGRISREDLNKVIAGQQSGKKIGTLLVEKSLFSREEIIECLKMQIEEIVYSLFGWKDGQFDFLQDKTPPTDSILSELNQMYLYL